MIKFTEKLDKLCPESALIAGAGVLALVVIIDCLLRL